LAGLAVIASGCGTTETTQTTQKTPESLSTRSARGSAPSTPAAQTPGSPPLQTYIGGQIFKIDRTRPLLNAFGATDILGRRVYAGYTELRYQGLTADGKLVLRLTEVEAHSIETTPGNRYSQGNVSPQANLNGTVTEPPKGAELIPPKSTEFLFDAKKEKELTVGGMKVRFLEFTPQSVKYSLEKAQ